MTPATWRLYYDDPFLLDFDGMVLGHANFQGRPSVVLDRSAFYPESGGQLCDLGTLGELDVTDVQVDDAGVVHHLFADGATLPAPGSTAHGRVERSRRRLHMSLHTGQHMLSGALVEEAAAETVSSRLGSTESTIDVNLTAIDDAALARAESLVNRLIEDDRPVRAFFPSPDELAALPLRRRPKVTENIRIVDAGGFDFSPCGGTHCTRTAQVGGVTILGTERYKGKVRVTFLAGRAAWQELGARSKALAALAQSFTCGVGDVAKGVERLRAELQSARESAGAARERWATLQGVALVAEAVARGEGRVAYELDDAPVETMRALAKQVTTAGLVALLASRSAEGLQVLLARPEQGSAFDCGAWLKRAAAATGGRGGGRADRAEGRLPPTADWAALTRDG